MPLSRELEFVLPAISSEVELLHFSQLKTGERLLPTGAVSVFRNAEKASLAVRRWVLRLPPMLKSATVGFREKYFDNS